MAEDNLIAGLAVPQPDSLAPSCDSSGWQFKVEDHRNRMLVEERFTFINRNAPGGGSMTFTFSASKQTTTEFSFSVGLSAEAGNAAFGKVQASINAGVRKTSSYGVSFGGSATVPAQHKATARLGFNRTIADGESFYLDQQTCKKTQVKDATVKAPYTKAWDAKVSKLA